MDQQKEKDSVYYIKRKDIIGIPLLELLLCWYAQIPDDAVGLEIV